MVSQHVQVNIKFRDVNVKATLELDPEKRPWNKAQATGVEMQRAHGLDPHEAPHSKCACPVWVGFGLDCTCFQGFAYQFWEMFAHLA